MKNNAEKIRDINSVGWDGLDANVSQLRIKDTDVQRQLDIAYRKCFQTAEGKKVLDHLKQLLYSNLVGYLVQIQVMVLQEKDKIQSLEK